MLVTEKPPTNFQHQKERLTLTPDPDLRQAVKSLGPVCYWCN